MYWSEKEEEARKIASSKKHFITYSQHSARKFGKSVAVLFFAHGDTPALRGRTQTREIRERELCVALAFLDSDEEGAFDR